MDGHTYASYFLQPEALAHTRYEALRAVCVDELSLRDAASFSTSASGVNFFHLDCLSSEVRLNVDLDARMGPLAHSAQVQIFGHSRVQRSQACWRRRSFLLR